MARFDDMLSALGASAAIPGVMGVGPGRTWDAVVAAHAPALTGDTASLNRNAMGCTGTWVTAAACSKLAWNGSRPWPSLVVPSGNMAITWPRCSASAT